MLMLPQCKQLLHQMKLLWPQYELDGCNDVWIFKPGAKSRGRGLCLLLFSFVCFSYFSVSFFASNMLSTRFFLLSDHQSN